MEYMTVHVCMLTVKLRLKTYSYIRPIIITLTYN